MWIAKRTNTYSVYRKVGAGSYALMVEVTDTNNPSGVFAIEASDATIRWDNVRGGSINPPQRLYPDGDIAATGWSTAPLWSKVDEAAAGGDVITAVSS